MYHENIRLTFAQLKEEVGPGLNPKGGQVLGGEGWNCRDSSRLWGWGVGVGGVWLGLPKDGVGVGHSRRTGHR